MELPRFGTKPTMKDYFKITFISQPECFGVSTFSSFLLTHLIQSISPAYTHSPEGATAVLCSAAILLRLRNQEPPSVHSRPDPQALKPQWQSLNSIAVISNLTLKSNLFTIPLLPGTTVLETNSLFYVSASLLWTCKNHIRLTMMCGVEKLAAITDDQECLRSCLRWISQHCPFPTHRLK